MTWRTVPEHCMPYPEIVEPVRHPAPYEIIDTKEKRSLPTNGMVSKVERRLMVPLDPCARHVSRHELAHVRWSPERPVRVRYDPRVLLSVEDARINIGLARLDLPCRLATGERAYVGSLAAQDLERHDVAAFVLRAIAALGTNADADVLAPADDGPPEVRALAERLVERVRSGLLRDCERRRAPVATFERVRALAREVARELESLGLLETGGPSRLVVLADAGCPLVDDGGEGEDEEEGLSVERLLGRGTARRPGAVVPGRMRVKVAPLDVVFDPRCGGRRREWRPSTEGSVVRWVHRFPIDGAIFRRPVRRRGGTVLVDTSGSMSLSASDVGRIIRGAPSATLVAIYSGRAREGELRIVARDGKCAAPEHLKPYAGGNVVDVPALEWLAKQRPPRVWISDGHVTGVGDTGSPAIDRRCAAICTRGRVRRVRKVEEAVRVLEGRGGRPTSPRSG